MPSIGSSFFSVSVPKLALAPFSAPKIDTVEIFSYVNSILGVLYLIDTIYRLWLSARVIRRHWSNSLIELPPCDVRAERGSMFFSREAVCEEVPAPVTSSSTHPIDIERPIDVIDSDEKSKPSCCKPRLPLSPKRAFRGSVSMIEAVAKIATGFPMQCALILCFFLFFCYGITGQLTNKNAYIIFYFKLHQNLSSDLRAVVQKLHIELRHAH